MRRLGSVVVLALSMSVVGAAAGERPLGDSRVVARMPAAPGYPEGIAIDGSTIYVATAARFGTALIPPKGPPEIQAFDRATGALLRRIAIATPNPNADHGTSGLAFDSTRRLYVLDTQWGVVRFDPETVSGAIDPGTDPSLIYASAFPDLPPCIIAAPPCSPTPVDAPPLPNDIAFAVDGDAFVTDSLQATIWRVPAGGGAPVIWFQDARLGGGFGVNGIRFDVAHQALYVTVTADGEGKGRVYRIPADEPGAMTAIHSFVAGEAPDNLAFGASGSLYVALAGSNQVAMLDAQGTEVRRFSGPAWDGEVPVPWDMPSGVAVDGATGTLLVNNHSEILGLPPHFVVFDVVVDETGEPLAYPSL